jgi:hypothetical protein
MSGFRRGLRVELPRILAAVTASAILSGCTVVQVYGEAAVTRTWAFAPLTVAPKPDGQSVVVATARGFGLVPGLRGVTLGYRNEAWAVVADPADCRVIFFGASSQLIRDSQIRALAAQSKGGDICIISNLPNATQP